MKKTKARRRSKKKHRSILDAAAILLTERGYCSVTMDQIAARAGVGKQTIYRWWKCKTALYIELYDEIARKHIKPVDTGSLSNDVKTYSEGLLAQLTDPVASLAFRGMVAEAQDSRESCQLFQGFMVGRFSITRAIIKNAISRGEIPRRTHVDSISSLVGGAVVWRLLLGNQKLDKKFVNEMAATVLRGLIGKS